MTKTFAMFDLKVCTVCLKSDVKIYSLGVDQLRNDYNLVSGLKTHTNNGFPEYLCYQCVGYVKSFKKYRDKCQRTYYALQQILHKNKEITKSIIDELDCDALNIKPTLSYLLPNHNKTKYECTKFKWDKKNRTGLIQQDNIPLMHQTTTSDYLSFEVPAKKPKLLMELIDECIKQEDSTVENNTYELHTETNNIHNDDAFFDSHFDNCNEDPTEFEVNEVQDKENADIDGMKLDKDYATVVPLKKIEAKAAVDVYKLFSHGTHRCLVCSRGYFSQNRLDLHTRMHDTHTSGTFLCDLCHYYYRTEFLLKTHMADKHMYKYLCKKCPEVSFDKNTAKKHYVRRHFQDTEVEPSEEKNNSIERKKNIYTHPVVKKKTLPKDYPIYTPVSQEEQYALVRHRKVTKNYIESEFKCEYCFKGFREQGTYDNHMQKHDPKISGNIQCDACKIYCKDTRKMYKHMNLSHLFKYSCQMCKYVCFSSGQARMHYRWHKNVKYSCPHCKKEFSKISTQLTHIRIKHPSMNICNLCGHSFVSVTGLYCHKKIAHSQEDIDEVTEVDPTSPLYCKECKIQFKNEAAHTTHFGSSYKHVEINLSTKPVRRGPGAPRRGRPRRASNSVLNTGVAVSTNCEICAKFLPNDSQAKQHYDSEHPGAPYLKRYMCDICGHTTRQYANLMVHMRTHTQEKPYACQYCERRFSMPSNRDRHLVVHTGEKRYQCPHCNRRFTQSSAVKLHIQTVHLKIPYAPWDKKNRKRRRDQEPVPEVRTAPELTRGNYLSAYITYNE